MFRRTILNKTVKELRKNQYFTAKELADKLHLDTIEILKLDDKKLKDVEEPLRSQLIPILRGDYMDKIHGL